MEPLPPARPGTALRVLATTDLAGTLVPVRTSYGEGAPAPGWSSCWSASGDRQPTVWLDAGDFTEVGLPPAAMVQTEAGPLGVVMASDHYGVLADLNGS